MEDIKSENDFEAKILDSCFVLFKSLSKKFSELPIGVENEAFDVSRIVISHIRDNIESLIFLAKNSHGSSAYIILRVLVESIIMFHYLHSCESDERKRYVEYFLHKMIRLSQNKEVLINNKKIDLFMDSKSNPEITPEIESILNKFTSGKKRPATKWTDKTNVEKLAQIDLKGTYDIGLLAREYLLVYEDASEMIHASSYGCVYLSPAIFDYFFQHKDYEKFKFDYRQHLRMQFLIIGFLLVDIYAECGKVLKNQKIIDDSKEIKLIFKQLLEIRIRTKENKKFFTTVRTVV